MDANLIHFPLTTIVFLLISNAGTLTHFPLTLISILSLRFLSAIFMNCALLSACRLRVRAEIRNLYLVFQTQFFGTCVPEFVGDDRQFGILPYTYVSFGLGHL